MPHRIRLASALIAAALLAAACAGKLKGVVDFDNSRDFGSVSRIGFFEDEKPLERPTTQVRERVRSEIEKHLKEKGYAITQPDEAQLLVVYHTANRTKTRTSGAISAAGREASLAIEFRGRKSERTVWYGTVEQTWRDGIDVDERVDTAVRVLLEGFPPDTKGFSKGQISVSE